MIILRQKNYNVLSDLYHSGVRRTYKKTVGRARRKAAQKLSQSALNDIKEYNRLVNTVQTPVINNQKVRENLINQVPRRTQVISINNYPNGGSGHLNNSFIGEGDFNELRKYNNPVKIESFRRSVNSGKYDNHILYTPNMGEENLAHELGHVINTRGILSKQVDKIAANSPDVGMASRVLIRSGNHEVEGIKNTGELFARGKIIELNEANASRKGLRSLKKSGISKEELNASKQKLQASGKTYRLMNNATWKTSLRNTIQIPSRKGNTILGDVVPRFRRKEVFGGYKIPSRDPLRPEIV